MSTHAYGTLVVALVALTACGSGSTGPSYPASDVTAVVSTSASAFLPATIVVSVGDTVAFRFGSTAHNVYFDVAPGVPADVGGANANRTVIRAFGTAGTYRYQCHLHAGMAGTVTVERPALATFVLRDADALTPPAHIQRYDTLLGTSVYLDGRRLRGVRDAGGVLWVDQDLVGNGAVDGYALVRAASR
jgi:plastocyanin